MKKTSNHEVTGGATYGNSTSSIYKQEEGQMLSQDEPEWTPRATLTDLMDSDSQPLEPLTLGATKSLTSFKALMSPA